MELRPLIRAVAADMPDDATPRDIADKVAASVPECDVRRFFAESVVELVRDTINFGRQKSLSNVVQNNGSAKLAQRRDWWTQMLAERVHIGDGTWKVLAQCTTADLGLCIAERQGQIAAINGQIANFETLIAAMKKHRVKAVADLKPEWVQR